MGCFRSALHDLVRVMLALSFKFLMNLLTDDVRETLPLSTLMISTSLHNLRINYLFIQINCRTSLI